MADLPRAEMRTRLHPECQFQLRLVVVTWSVVWRKTARLRDLQKRTADRLVMSAQVQDAQMVTSGQALAFPSLTYCFLPWLQKSANHSWYKDTGD